MSIRSFILAMSVTALFSGYAESRQMTTARPSIGSHAPNFKLNTPGGETVELASMRAKGPVVLIMLRGFPGYQCPYCTAQVGEFMKRIKDFQAAGANIVAVYPGPAHGLTEHAEDFIRGKIVPDNFYLVLDPDYSFTNAYGLRWDAPGETAHPATFLVTRDGVVRFVKISNTHGDRAGADDLLAALRAEE
jgi:thioredoxin-dependent peroxiredoxin